MLKETPITIQRHHFGLEDTTTKVLTQTNYVAIISTGDPQGGTIDFQIRLNTPWDWFLTSLSTPAAGAYAPGRFTQMMPFGTSTTWPAVGSQLNFPLTMSSSEAPQWRTWFGKMYQYYTVLGLEYEITLMNPMTGSNVAGWDMVAYYFTDSYSATNATTIHPRTRPLAEMEQWPDVQFMRVPSSGDYDTKKNYRTIKGYYRPGSVRSSVENDEDMRTWTKTGSQPSLTEILTVGCGKAWDHPGASTICPGLNVRIDMRWIVQFKDLNVQYRWPAGAGQAAITHSAPSEIIYTP